MRTLTNNEIFSVSGGKEEFVCRVSDFGAFFSAYDSGSYGPDLLPTWENHYPPRIELDSGALESMNFFTPRGFIISFAVEGAKAGWRALRNRLDD